jgi:hypothetical protein
MDRVFRTLDAVGIIVRKERITTNFIYFLNKKNS